MRRRDTLALSLAAGFALSGRAQPAAAGSVDDIWVDAARQRSVPVRIRWPVVASAGQPSPVVLFSHGLGGTRAGGAVWGEAWSAAGFVSLHLQHPGSDFDALRGGGGLGGGSALRSATSPQQLLARVQDVVFVLDEIGRRHAAREGRWAGVRPDAVGMSGHSFGAHTTLGMAGQRYPGHPGVDEPRLAAFIAFSPTIPARGDAVRAFDRITRPMLCLTGTLDGDVVGNGSTPQNRAAVFAALPAGRKAQLLLQDADHMSFAGQTGRAVEILPRSDTTRGLQAAHHALIARVSTDWWRATLLDDAAARNRLVAPEGLSPGDRWQSG